MWALANINRIWLLLRDGVIVLASKKWDLYDGRGKFIVSGVKMRDYASKELGCPAYVERIWYFSPEQVWGFHCYLTVICATPAAITVAAPTKDKPAEKLQRPVVKLDEEDLAAKAAKEQKIEEGLLLRQLSIQVANSLNYEVLEASNLVVIRGNDDVGRDCIAVVQGTEITPHEPAKVNRVGTKSRNRWFAEKLKRLVAEAAFVEMRRLDAEENYA